MSNIFQIYKEKSFEQKTIILTVCGLCISTVLASGKLVIGIFTDHNLCSVAVYTFAMLLAKLECVLGVKSNKRSFQNRNLCVAVFLFFSSVFYVGFMCRMFFIERKTHEYSFIYVLLLAFISFIELGFAIAGILRTKNKGHFYRNIKIINFCISLMAILTTQMALLDYCSTANTDVYNAYTGIGVGCFTAACAVFIFFAPKISVIDKEHNVFELVHETENKLINTSISKVEITLCSSTVFGSYVYRASLQNGRLDGNIERAPSLWKRMHVSVKILCCILSEILLFVWLFGRLIFALRSLNIPKRLEIKMNENGFVKVG